MSIVSLILIEFWRLSWWYWNARRTGQRGSHWTKGTKRVCSSNTTRFAYCFSIDQFNYTFPVLFEFVLLLCCSECPAVQVNVVFVLYASSSSSSPPPPTISNTLHVFPLQAIACLPKTERTQKYLKQTLFSILCTPCAILCLIYPYRSEYYDWKWVQSLCVRVLQWRW